MTGPDVSTDPRMVGCLKRYHTWPVVRERTLAEHSWNVCRVALAIHPSMSRDVLVYALLHDIGEGRAGDPPFPVKREHPEYGRTHAAVEEQAWREMVIPWQLPARPTLGEFEMWVVKLADMIESWETGLEEVMRGNRLAQLIVDRSTGWLRDALTPSVHQEHYLWRCSETEQGVWIWENPWSEVVDAAKRYMDKRRAVWRVSK